MSHQAVNWAIEQKAGGPAPKATLWSIANYANEHWCAWPSQKTICGESEQSPDAVQRWVKVLAVSGLIRRIALRYAGRRSVDFFILRPSPYFASSMAEIEAMLPRGFSVFVPSEGSESSQSGPQPNAAANRGNVAHAAANATAHAAANAAALERQHITVEPRNQVDGGGDAGAREALISAEATAVAEEVAAIAGLPDPTQWPPGWCGAPSRVQAFLGAGYLPDDLRIGAHTVMANKRDGPPQSIEYFKWAFAKARGQRERPVPSAINSSEVSHAQTCRPNPIAAAADRILRRVDAEIAEIEARLACDSAS